MPHYALEGAGNYEGLIEQSALKYSDETNSGWIITLVESKATKSAWFLYAETDEATETAFNAIASPTEWTTQGD